jgi:hypothetical protein
MRNIHRALVGKMLSGRPSLDDNCKYLNKHITMRAPVILHLSFTPGTHWMEG